MDSRAKDDLPSKYEPTDVFDESALRDVENIGEDKADDTSEAEVILFTKSWQRGLESYTAKEVPLDKTLTTWTALEVWQMVFFRTWLCLGCMRSLDPSDNTHAILGYKGREATRMYKFSQDC